MPEDGEKPGSRTFEIALPALIQGLDKGEREFAEQTVVSTINAEEAVVLLRSKVKPGAKIRLSLHIPRTFFLEKPLDLNLTGTISEIPAPEKGVRAKAAVRVRLDDRFSILPASV
ncbi:MAG: hypothetical protein JW843_12490 [Candidatus Aminicenantes bacterium]|nr:hypothetical protein [Candidatus Aminicenantes bacterium]